MSTDWSLGIFTVMTIIVAIIAAISAIRFIYLDKQYDKIIKKRQEDSDQLEQTLIKLIKSGEKNIREEIPALLDEFQREIGKYTAKKENNRRQGLFLDIFALFGVLSMAILATFGIFDGSILALNIILLFLVLISFVNFMTATWPLIKSNNTSV